MIAHWTVSQAEIKGKEWQPTLSMFLAQTNHSKGHNNGKLYSV